MEVTQVKSVLQFLSPGTRLEISRTCPTLRNIEKMTPLNLRYAHFSDYQLRVDDIIYKLGVIRVYHEGETPDFIEKENEKGGVRYDVNDYGLKIEGQVITRKADEIVIDGRANQLNQHNDETDSVAKWEQDLKKLERDKATRLQNIPTPAHKEIIAGIDKRIKDLKDRLLPYKLQRENGEPPYTHQIKLETIKKVGETCKKTYEHVLYERKLHNAMKYLIKKTLGGRERTTAIKIKKLQVYAGGLICIPSLLSLHVSQVDISTNISYNLSMIRPILSRRSLPLECIVIHETGPFPNSIINNAQKIIVAGDHFELRLNYYPQSTVHVIRQNFPKDEILTLAKSWVRDGRPLGTRFSFRAENNQLEKVENLWNDLEKMGDHKVDYLAKLMGTRFNYILVFLLTETNEINISCTADSEVPGAYNLTIEVVPIPTEAPDD